MAYFQGLRLPPDRCRPDRPPTAPTAHNDAVIEKERRELMVAADILEELADRTTGGHWRIGGLLASRPEVIAEWPDGATEHVAEARALTSRHTA